MGPVGAPLLTAVALLWVLPPAAGATAPGANGKIAYSYIEGGGQPRALRAINPDGSGEAPISGTFFAADTPAWSPAGDMLAFRCWLEETGGEGICTSQADGAAAQLVASKGTNSNPTWSVDGTDLAFGAASGARFDPSYVWRVDADGSDPIRLRVGFSPDWSPITRPPEIAYVKEDATGQFHIYRMPADNSDGEHKVTESVAADNLSPSWSPDGTIAFESERDGNSEIYITDANGGIQNRLTVHPGEDVDPDVSPNGTQIVFASNRDGDYDLYVMDIDGTDVTQLTNSPGSETAPDWQTLPEGYPRPKGATPFRVPLVPAFDECTAPNRTHGPPLAFGSCNPPTTPSRYATVGTMSIGHVRLDVVGLPDNTWEARVSASLSDVKRLADGADALGALDLTVTPQVTDDANSPQRLLNGTMTKPNYFENPLHVDMPCNPTADPATGSTCSVQTSFEALTGLSGERAVIELDKVTVYDGGDDGFVDSRDDNTLLAVQGVFVP